MKKQYVVALACLVAGTIGFVGVYSTEQSQNQESQQLSKVEDTQKISETAKILKSNPKKKLLQQNVTQQNSEKNQIAKNEVEKSTKKLKKDTPKADNSTKTIETSRTVDKFHFSKGQKYSWPLSGEVIMPYCMDKTIYRKTLDQYQYNPAMIIKGKINSDVYFIAKGKILDVSEKDETGCTITQDLGDGYKAVYGQLKEPVFKKGDMVEAGQVAGYVAEPTKYYSLEGSNLYFQITRDGKPVNPEDYLKNTKD